MVRIRTRHAFLSVGVAAALLLSGCGSSKAQAGPKAADVQPEGSLPYQGFQEVRKTFTDEKQAKGGQAGQQATQDVFFHSPQVFKSIDVMSWYSKKYTDAGWGSCPDASTPDLSNYRVDYCKRIDDRQHHAILIAGSRGDVQSQDFEIRYTIGPKLVTPKTTTTTTTKPAGKR